MEHVRRHWKQRPFKYDTLALDDRLDPSALDPNKEWEVDGVSSRRYLHGKYKYAVTYKGATSPWVGHVNGRCILHALSTLRLLK